MDALDRIHKLEDQLRRLEGRVSELNLRQNIVEDDLDDRALKPCDEWMEDR